MVDLDGAELSICEDCYRLNRSNIRSLYKVHWEFALEYMHKEKLKESVKCLVHCLRITPDSQQAIGTLGLALDRLGKLHWAKHYYEKAILKDPKDKCAKVNYSLLLKKFN
ncbi:MAG TPA: hypothetical protein VGE29_12515 [Prosthecobacter sp.]